MTNDIQKFRIRFHGRSMFSRGFTVGVIVGALLVVIGTAIRGWL